MKKIFSFYEKTRKKEEKIKWGLYNFLIIALALINFSTYSLFFGEDYFHFIDSYDFVNECIGWVISFTFGSFIFLSSVVTSSSQVIYKNVKASKYIFEYKGNLDSPIWFPETNMSLKQDLIIVFLNTILIIILFFYNLCGLVLFFIFYQFLILFNDFIFSLFFSQALDTKDKLFQINFDEFIREKTLNDVIHSTTKKDGDIINFDIQLLYDASEYVEKNNYTNPVEFNNDIEYILTNIKYIVTNNKFEYKVSFFNIEYYLKILDQQAEFIKKENAIKKQTGEILEMLSKALKKHMQKSQDDWYFANYSSVIDELNAVQKKIFPLRIKI